MNRALLAVVLVACGAPSAAVERDAIEPPAVAAVTAPPPSSGDRDDDLILDRCDRCPDEPEDYQTMDDEDGCPEPNLRYVIESSHHGAAYRVFFREGSSALDERWPEVRDAIVHSLSFGPAVEVVVVGRALPSEPDPRGLAAARARAVAEGLSLALPRVRFVPHGRPFDRMTHGTPEHHWHADVLETVIAPLQWYQDPYVLGRWDGERVVSASTPQRDRPEGPARCPEEVMARYRRPRP